MPIPVPPPSSAPNRNVVDGRVLKHLRRRLNLAVELEALTDTPDNQGGQTRTWATFATVNGALEPLSAQERLARGVSQAVGMFTAYIEFRNDVDVRQRLRIGGRLFDVHGVTDLGEQQLILALDVTQRFTA